MKESALEREKVKDAQYDPVGYVKFEYTKGTEEEMRLIRVCKYEEDYCIACGKENNLEEHLWKVGDPEFWYFKLCKKHDKKFDEESKIFEKEPDFEVRSLNELTEEEIENLCTC